MNFAETLTPEARRGARLNAYASTWFGCFTDVMIDSSAIIILYLTMLKSSEMATMFAMSFSGIVAMFMMIPMAGVVDRFGVKRCIYASAWIALGSYLLMAIAPVFGKTAASGIVLTGCLLFSVSRPLWSAAWYPLLNDILLPEERGTFFGRMRFSYMILTGSVFFVIGLVMGENPPEWFLQTVIGAAGLLMFGRIVCISRIPVSASAEGKYDLKKAFGISIRNGPLVSFSVYVCCLSAAFCSLAPLVLLYLKKGIGCGDNVVQTVSSVGIAGLICGYFFYGPLLAKIGMKRLQLITHALYIVIPFLLFLCGKSMPAPAWIAGGLLFIGNFAFACFNCSFSRETLALARPDNSVMAMAFCQTYQQLGMGSGRVVTSFLLGSGMLATQWNWRGLSVCNYQTLFLIEAFFGLFCLIMLFCIPSVVPKHEDYYEP